MANWEYRDKVVCITGASAGIGAALAREAAALGAALVLLARREDRVKELAAECSKLGRPALAFRCDVTQDGELQRSIATAAAELGGIDVVFANAGYGVQGNFTELSLADYRAQFETNVFGVLRTIEAAYSELAKRQGRIAVVGSTNGYVSIPGWSAYCMSKHAVRSLCACLKHEFRAAGISVTHVAPGFIESEFRLIRRDGTLAENATDPIPSWLYMPAAKAARLILRSVAAREDEVIITQHAKLAIGLERLVPTAVSRAMRLGASLVTQLSRRGE